MGVEFEDNANSAKVDVKVEAELGNRDQNIYQDQNR